MDSGYTLSDMAAATSGNCFGGEGLWIFALLLLMFGSNGNGFFGRNGAGDYGQFASAASQQEILFGQQFQGLDNKIDRIGNGIADATFALNNAINSVQTNVGAQVNAEGRAIQTQLCAINSNIDNKFAALEKSQLEQKINDQASQIAALQTQSMLCGIPRVNNTAWGVYPYAGCGCGYNGNI